MNITCDKLTGLSPTWATFRGWSILFDPLDRPHAEFRQTLTDANADVFELLNDLTRRFTSLRRTTRNFVALPSETYHITLCDGINDRLVRRSGGGAASFLAPEAALVRFRSAITALLEAASVAQTFVVTGGEIRGHAVVAAVTPLDDVTELLAQRRDLLDQIGSAIAAELVTPWHPHITLGYLANMDDLESDRLAMDHAWASIVAEHPGDDQLTYRTNSASLYGFTDMVSFSNPRRPV